MQRLLIVFSLLACLAVMFMPAGTASAAHPWYPGQTLGAWPNYYGWGASPYSLGQVPVPPYFALHPPVYYSMPVPRSYGFSPYAYPATVMTPEVVPAEPAVVENPHVESSSTVPADAGPTEEAEGIDSAFHSAAVRPAIIENPFVAVEIADQAGTQRSAQ